MSENTLNIEVYYGEKPPWANSTILSTDSSCILIDTQFLKSDARQVAERIKEIGKPLKAIFVTHFHPDHVWGGAELLEHFPDATVYARPEVKQDIELDFSARMLRWTGWFNVGPYAGEVPDKLFPIEAYTADTYHLDGHEIRLIDLMPAETINATAFYLPESKTYIAGDHLYNKCHYYIGAGLNRPDLWIDSLEAVMSNYQIERVVPGHGYVGGTEIFDEAIEYLRYYEAQYEPYKPQEEMVEAMLERYKDWHLEGVLYMAIGPAVTSPELLKKTGGHASFGVGPIAEGSFRG
jgi:glyoxylase-like metal-dependent hydrolase (beta-lactamase superfamily II)